MDSLSRILESVFDNLHSIPMADKFRDDVLCLLLGAIRADVAVGGVQFLTVNHFSTGAQEVSVYRYSGEVLVSTFATP